MMQARPLTPFIPRHFRSNILEDIVMFHHVPDRVSSSIARENDCLAFQLIRRTLCLEMYEYVSDPLERHLVKQQHKVSLLH